MARIESLAILTNESGKEFLAEQYGAVIANIQKNMISSKLKNTALSGTPTAGSVEAKRFVNRNSNAYGTARTGNAGQKVKAEPVTIAINVDRELLTEVEQKDVSLYGVDNFVERQAAMDQKSMERELERAFFTTAAAAATEVTPTGTDPQDMVEEAIQALETVKNDYVDGVPRDMITVVCAPAVYGKLRTYLDTVSDGGSKGETINMYHGARIESSTYLPTGVKMIVMADGAVAQPVLPTVAPAQKIQLSNAYAFGMFYSYGTKAVAPDMIMKVNA